LEVGHGIGSSKKEAEQKAAQSATYEPSDEECARMLDRLDKMEKR
jgi:ribonuclease-3